MKNISFIIAVLICILFAVYSIAEAVHWKLFYKEGVREYFYYDHDSIRYTSPSKDTVKLWFKLETWDGKETKYAGEILCSNYTIELTAISTTFQGDKKYHDKSDKNYQQVIPYHPESAFGELAKSLCP